MPGVSARDAPERHQAACLLWPGLHYRPEFGFASIKRGVDRLLEMQAMAEDIRAKGYYQLRVPGLR
jgi:hypothetical protein